MPYDIVDAYEDIRTLESKYRVLVSHLIEKGVLEAQAEEPNQEKKK